MKPLVTVVITTYKRDEKVLGRAINSVLKQSYPCIELIVVDDNGEGTIYNKKVKKLIDSYNIENINLITHKKNSGVQRARNKGLEIAKGEYIGFLDDDDEWLPDKILRQVEKFEESKDDSLALVYCYHNIVKINLNNDRIVEKQILSEHQQNVVQELFRHNFIGSTSFPLLKKKYVKEVGGFDERLSSTQDLDLWIRIAKKYKVSLVKEVLVNYYYYSGEKITNNPSAKINGLQLFYEKYKNNFESDLIAKFNFWQKIGNFQIKFDNYSEAREAFARALKIKIPTRIKLKALKGIFKSYIFQILSLFNRNKASVF